MTREEILGMEVGRELDALILEYVFNDCDYHGDYLITVEERDFHPSTDIKAAWEVVEVLRKRGIYFDIHVNDTGYHIFNYIVHYGEPELYPGWYEELSLERCKTAPEAICKAALLAVLEEKAEV
jgi:hypothetical protein